MPDATPPGADPFAAELQERLAGAIALRGPAYVPRTHHLDADGRPLFINRLALETSPYLLQHAHNPVNWFPWGDEAFAEARRLGRPVFLDRHSTCLVPRDGAECFEESDRPLPQPS